MAQYGIDPISIHVPREGDDPRKDNTALCFGISIHVPREGDDAAAAPPRPGSV